MKTVRHARLISSLLLSALVSRAILAQENSWASHGPTDVGWVNDVAIVGSVAYAGTLNGVFRSVDEGASWQPSGLEGITIIRIEARQGAPAVFALATGVWPSPNVYVSTDAGQTWSSVPGQDSAIVIGIDPERLSTVYAGWNGGQIWRSTDAGANWQQVSTLPASGYPLALAFSSDAIYALTSDNLYKSLDGAASWTASQPPLGAPTAIATGSAAGVVYAAVSGKVCTSTDSAATWACLEALTAYSVSRILEVPGSSPATPRLLLSSAGGVFLSRDSGATWTSAGDGLHGFQPALGCDAAGSLVLAGTDTRIFRSRDRGDTWTGSAAGLKSVWIDAIALDPTDPSTVWAGGIGNSGSGPGLFRSTDEGNSWSPAGGPQGPAGVSALAIDPDHPSTMYAGSSAVFRTDDGGQSWTQSAPGPSSLLNVLALDPASSARVWAGSGSGLFRSDDGARTWEPASVAQGIYCLLFNDRHPDTIYAGSYWDVSADYYGVEGGSTWVSQDHGETFTRGAWEFPSPIYTLARDPFQDGLLFAGTAAGGVYRSADFGVTWQSASQGLGGAYGIVSPIFQLVADPVRPGYLYCSTSDGVFRTVDGARTWQSLSDGLPLQVTGRLVIAPDGARLYAGTAGGGVFELDLASAPPTPCVASATRLCLVGNRYAVDLIDARPGTGAWTPGSARPLGDRAGYFSFPSVTGKPDLPEVVVKMLPDGAFGRSGAPLFYASLTNLPYHLTVTDTLTGRNESHDSDSSAPLCGGTSVSFPASEDSAARRATPKAGTGAAIPLLGGRFSVTLEAHRPGSDQSVTGVAMASGDDFGIFSLPGFTGDEHFPEVVVKMIDASALDGNFWFFHTGLTNLDYTLTVSDSVTGAVRTYDSPAPFCGGADTRAFGPWDTMSRAPRAGADERGRGQRAASAATADSNILMPASLPRSFSEQRSGCGMRPTTLPSRLQMPAMASVAPFGLAESTTRPSGSQ